MIFENIKIVQDRISKIVDRNIFVDYFKQNFIEFPKCTFIFFVNFYKYN